MVLSSLDTAGNQQTDSDLNQWLLGPAVQNVSVYLVHDIRKRMCSTFEQILIGSGEGDNTAWISGDESWSLLSITKRVVREAPSTGDTQRRGSISRMVHDVYSGMG